MTFKRADVASAVGLIISGFLRNPELNEDQALRDALGAIRQECDDWAENLELGPDEAGSVNVQLNVPRTPYNIRTAIKELMREAVDLNGEDFGRAIIAGLQTATG